MDDPYLWLEEVEGERALGWVRTQNEKTMGTLQADPRFETFKEEALEILSAEDRIPMPTVRGGQIYNFWQDETHVRGLWRRTSLESYRTDEPDWEILLDIDALGKDEGVSWFTRAWLACRRTSPNAFCVFQTAGLMLWWSANSI